MKNENSTEERRSNNWNFLLYPESAPTEWIQILDDTHIEWVCSPLHDKDINPDNTPKKEHYHITLLFPSLKSFDQVEAITKSINAPIPIRCQSVKGSIRYMVHKDNPEKFQYKWSDIKSYGGADLSSLCAPTSTERLQIQKDILDFIDANSITEFCDLLDCVRKMQNNNWLNICLNFSTMAINAYIKSRRHKAEKEIQTLR